jgi:hypothetical protein
MIRKVGTYLRRNHLALLALFLALGGTSYAAGSTLLPRNSVGSKQVVNGSLKTIDLSKKARRALRGQRGALGPQGRPGPTQFARVNSTGQLVSGTATSASRLSTGIYFVRFPTAVDQCGGAASSAAFPGFDSSVVRTLTHVSIGFGQGGADPLSVSVDLFLSNGSAVDSAFTLVLACPSG